MSRSDDTSSATYTSSVWDQGFLFGIVTIFAIGVVATAEHVSFWPPSWDPPSEEQETGPGQYFQAIGAVGDAGADADGD